MIMDNQIILLIKKKLREIPVTSGPVALIKRNSAKEQLQYYVLNFIYNNSKYNKWIMYGGSALRICHKLNRMSVDLDFEVNHKITNKFLGDFESKIVSYFKNDYNVDSGILTTSINNKRGITLKFKIGDKIGLNFASKIVKVKIDLNYFKVPETVVVENHPINEDQFSFIIRTYNMSALMSSKIAAIFLRGKRGVGKEIYKEKGRDIYDLLWYMSKKLFPIWII